MDKKEIREIIDIALSRGADFAEIFLEERETNSISCEGQKIEKINSGIDRGVGIRVISGNNTAYSYSNKITKENLSKIADHASKIAEGEKRISELNFITPPPLIELEIEEKPDKIKIEDKVAKVKECDEAARSVDDKIKQVTVGYGDVCQKVVIANSEGNYVEDERIRTRMVCNAIANDGSKIQTGYSSVGGVQGFELFKKVDPKSIGLEAANRAVLMLSAQASPSGKMPIVLAAEAGGTMVHEACGHGLEADLVQKNLSVYANKKGQKVASPLITVIDDATIPTKNGSYKYDDEGTPGQKTVLIKNGYLEQYMNDLSTSKKEKVAPTGNGRRESFKDRPIPRMTNTYIQKGNDDPEKIIKSTKYGLLVKKMGGGQVNTSNGDYVFDVAEGYLIEDGDITKPVRGATLTGNGPETLNRVEMVGKDLGFAIGVCGKEGQGVPVSDAQPTLKIKELIVGGTGGSSNTKIFKNDFKIKRL